MVWATLYCWVCVGEEEVSWGAFVPWAHLWARECLCLEWCATLSSAIACQPILQSPLFVVELTRQARVTWRLLIWAGGGELDRGRASLPWVRSGGLAFFVACAADRVEGELITRRSPQRRGSSASLLKTSRRAIAAARTRRVPARRAVYLRVASIRWGG